MLCRNIATLAMNVVNILHLLAEGLQTGGIPCKLRRIPSSLHCKCFAGLL